MASQHNVRVDTDLHEQAEELGDDQPGTASRSDPGVMAYMIGPPALLIVLVLEHFNLIASHSIWLWLAVFLATPAVSFLGDIAYRQNPNEFRSNVQLAAQVATITAVIYLTGWGPVLIAAYSFGALVSISRNGSRRWRPALAWSLLGILIGQILIALSMGADVPQPRSGTGGSDHERLRSVLRRSNGGRHHGQTGNGRRLLPPERATLPVPGPELH